jgi:hypothetical protein
MFSLSPTAVDPQSYGYNLPRRPMNILEPHFTPHQLAKAWRVSVEYIRRRFRFEPGTVMFGRTVRIPQSVAERVYRQAARQSVEGDPLGSTPREMDTERTG